MVTAQGWMAGLLRGGNKLVIDLPAIKIEVKWGETEEQKLVTLALRSYKFEPGPFNSVFLVLLCRHRSGASRSRTDGGKNFNTYARLECQNAERRSKAEPIANAVIAKLKLTTPYCFSNALNVYKT